MTEQLLTDVKPQVKQSSYFDTLFLFFCRDRIIHLLAIRPYKKPELIIRLRKGKSTLELRKVEGAYEIERSQQGDLYKLKSKFRR